MLTPRISKRWLVGLGLALVIAASCWIAGGQGWNRRLQVSPLTLAIVVGMAFGNAAPSSAVEWLHPGLRFCQQRLLRAGIVLYGIRLTLNDVASLGQRVLLMDLLVIGVVLLAGYWLGTRVFGLDRDTALLVSAGSGICGAAAILATDRVIESESHKVSVAVATVVLFGTVGMFLYPALYPFTGFSERQFGVYTGATVHEVAQVLAAGRAVSQGASDVAVITKMMRVLLLAPVLVIISRWRHGGGTRSRGHIRFPWFVAGFGAVIAAQSLVHLPRAARADLIDLDTVLLASAMFALGMGTRWQQLKTTGTRPLLLATAIFAGLVSGGWALARLLL